MVCKFWQEAILGAGLIPDSLRLRYSVIKSGKRKFHSIKREGAMTDLNSIQLDQEIEAGEKI